MDQLPNQGAATGKREIISAQARMAPLQPGGPLPWVQLRNAAFSAALFRKMVGRIDPRARDGDLVKVYDRDGAVFGTAFLNRKSQIALRMLGFGETPLAETFLEQRVAEAAALRRDVLQLEKVTNAYRLIYAEGDGLPGLIVDVFEHLAVVELFSLAMFQRAPQIEKALRSLSSIERVIFRADDSIQRAEGFHIDPSRTHARDSLVITEHDLRFQIDPTCGHKTGFFCDQRENRFALTAFTSGRNVLDLCCCTGGFGIYALGRGNAAAVTAVDLDEKAVALARRNANLNRLAANRYETVHADVFPYLRQMGRNNRHFDVVILDPPKLIGRREDFSEGRQAYFDLNKLAMGVVRPGGLLLTCSCSGLLDQAEFLNVIRGAGRSARRRVQIIRISGAGPDHPVMNDFLEGIYLKCLWCRLG